MFVNRAFVVASAAALVLLTGGCSSDSDTAKSSQSEAAAAYNEYKAAGTLFDCTTAFGDLDAAHIANDVPGQHAAARAYRDILARWNERVQAISFPEQARDAAQKLHEITLLELDDLDDIAAATTPEDATRLVWRIFVDDWKSFVASDELAASLGHTPSKARFSADKLGVARSENNRVNAEIAPLFNAAVRNGSLPAAIAANKIDERALRTYLAAIDSIDFPTEVADKVAQLKKDVQAAIEFDQQQVAVATTADIVLAPPEGGPTAKAEFQTFQDIQAALTDMDPAQPSPNCDETPTPTESAPPTP